MHNLHANFVKILKICKKFSYGLVNDLGNIPRRGVVPRFSDLEVIALSLTGELLGIDSENNLFDRLKEYQKTSAISSVAASSMTVARTHTSCVRLSVSV